MALIPTLTKLGRERRVFEVNLGPRLRPLDVIDEVTSVTVDDPAVSLDAVTWTAGTCQLRAAGGEPGRRYLLTISFRTAADPQQDLLAQAWIQIRGSAVSDAPLSPWPADADARAAAEDRLSSALQVSDTGEVSSVRRLGATASALVEQYAPAAPQPIRDEAVIRCAAYLRDQPAAAIRAESVGPLTTDFAVSRQAALRHSGSMSLLSPWRVRRAWIA